MNQICHFDHVVSCEECDGCGEVEVDLRNDNGECAMCGSSNMNKNFCSDCYFDGGTKCNKCDGGKVIKSWVDCDCDECQDSYFVVDANTEEYVSRHKSQLPAVIEATQYAAKNNASSYVFSGDSIYYRAFGDGDYAYDIFQGKLEPMVRKTQSAA